MYIFYQTLCRLRPLFFGLPLLLAASTVSSCSGDIADNLASAPSPAPAAPVDSILKFATIENFEAMTASEIPGGYADYELNALSYECVDTIEFRALLLDVTAQLTSPAGVKKDVIFKAEVGPELVSVEYVPGGEMIPAHHNMAHMFFPKVERYRNYSDGSRMGPDTFYDYGHPITISLIPGGNGGYMAWYCTMSGDIANYLESVVPLKLEDNSINPEAMYYENGVFHFYQRYEIEMNMNAKIVGPDGTIATGEDFLIKEVMRSRGLHDGYWCTNDDDRFSSFLGNYYGFVDEWGLTFEYHLDRPASNDEKELFNLCRDVPDVSKKPFPQDIKSLDEGWWFAPVYDVGYDYNRFFSSYFRKFSIWNNEISSFTHLNTLLNHQYYLQYLVIDGRIIHSDDLMAGYPGLNVTPKTNVSKISDGYLIRTEIETKIYGEKCKVTTDLISRGVNGPKVVYDLSDYFKIDGNDENEMNNLSETRSNEPTRVIEKKSFPEKKSMPREDGKTFEFDRSLPKSIGNLSRTRTIYPQSK